MNATRYRILLVILALTVSIAFQGSRGLYETTEGRYAECSREMMESGNYMKPTLNYQPHWSKPPLTYWAIIGGMKLFGENEWGVRFFNIVAFLGAVAAVYYMGTFLWGETLGLAAGLIYVSSPLPVFGAFSVSTDTLLALWELLAVMAYLRARSQPETRGSKKWITAMWLFFGLGFLTKGPIALLPLIPISVWQYFAPRHARVLSLWGIALFLMAGFSWFAATFLSHPELIDYYLKVEIIDRLRSGKLHNSEWYKGFTIYIPVLIFGGGPWLFLALWHSRKHLSFSRYRFIRNLKDGNPVVFMILWVFLPLVIFFIVKTRLMLYVLPLYAPLALLSAWGIIHPATEEKRLLRFTGTVAVVMAILLVGVKGGLSFFPGERDMKHLHQTILSLKPAPRADCYAFRQKKLYGLNFYLKGKLKRVSDGSMANLLSESCPGTRFPYIIFAKDQDAADLRNILHSAGLAYNESAPDDFFVFFTVDGRFNSNG